MDIHYHNNAISLVYTKLFMQNYLHDRSAAYSLEVRSHVHARMQSRYGRLLEDPVRAGAQSTRAETGTAFMDSAANLMQSSKDLVQHPGAAPKAGVKWGQGIAP